MAKEHARIRRTGPQTVVSLMKTSSPLSPSRAGTLAALLLLGSLAGLQAQGNRYWVGEGTNWNDTANWATTSGGSGGATVPSLSNGNAYFNASSPVADKVISLGGQTISLNTLNNAATDDFEIADGTIDLYGNITPSTAGLWTVSANLALQSGVHNITQTAGGVTGIARFSGAISGEGSLFSNGTYRLQLTGTNTFSGGFQVRSGAVEIGSNAAFGSGDLIFGTGASGDGPVIRSIGTGQYSVANDLYLRARTLTIGDFANVQTGTIVFNQDILFDDTNTAPGDIIATRTLRVYSGAVFKGDLRSAEGTGEKDLYIVSGTVANAAVSFEGTSTRTTDTYIGTASINRVSVTAKADNALGTGDIIIYGSTGVTTEVVLDGGDTGITLDNAFRPAVVPIVAESYLKSLRGDNRITGNVTIHTHTSRSDSETPIAVEAGTLTLSGGVSGASETALNTLRKTGAGVLSLTGATDSGIQRLRITDGTLRVIQGTSWTSSQSLNFAAGASASPVLETSGVISATLGTARGTISWNPGSSGGFAAYGDNLDINFYGAATRIWGEGEFVSSGSRLILNSATATHRVDFQNGINLNGKTETVEVLDNPALGSDYARISGVISGTGASHLGKTGAGALELTNANTYEGGTTISAGTLLVNNASGSGTGSGAVLIEAGATLGGSGFVAGATTISGWHRPGNSPGIQSFGSDLTYTTGAVVGWELGANTALQGAPGSETYDQVQVGGILAFTGPITLTLSFDAAGSTVDWQDDFWSQEQVWTIYSAASLVGAEQLSLASADWGDAFGHSFGESRSGGFFSLEASGGDLLLHYRMIPEPSTWAFLIGGATLLLARRRRRAMA